MTPHHRLPNFWFTIFIQLCPMSSWYVYFNPVTICSLIFVMESDRAKLTEKKWPIRFCYLWCHLSYLHRLKWVFCLSALGLQFFSSMDKLIVNPCPQYLAVSWRDQHLGEYPTHRDFISLLYSFSHRKKIPFLYRSHCLPTRNTFIITFSTLLTADNFRLLF